MDNQYKVLDAYPKIGRTERALIIRAFEREGSGSEEFEEFFAKNYLSQNPIYPSNVNRDDSTPPDISQLPVAFGAFREEPPQIKLESDESKTIWEILTDQRNSEYTSKFVADVNRNPQVKKLLNRKPGGNPVFINDVMYSSPFKMTVFVPSSSAYRDEDEANVLYHIVWDKYAHSPKVGENPMHQGSPTLLVTMYRGFVVVSSAKVMMDGTHLNYGSRASADLIIPDVRASNGILHVIDNILTPDESISEKSNANDCPELFISSPVTEVDARRKRKVIKSRYKEIKAKVPKTIYSKRTDKVSVSDEPSSFVDRISFSESKGPSFIDQISLTQSPLPSDQTSPSRENNSNVIEYSTLKVGLAILGKYFNLPEDSKALFKDKDKRAVMLAEANNIVSSLNVDESNKTGKLKISLNSNSYLGNEYSYFSPQKVKGMPAKDLMRFVTLTNALNIATKIEAPLFGSSLGRKLADNINSWIEEIMKDVAEIASSTDLFRLTVMEKSGRLAKKIYQKGGPLMIREVSWVIMNAAYVLEQILKLTFIYDEFRPEMEITVDLLYRNFGYSGVQKRFQPNVERFFGFLTSAEDKIVNNIVDLTKKVRKEELPNLQNNMILKEANRTKERLFNLSEFIPSEFKAPKKGDPNFVKLNLIALMYATLISDLYHDTKLDDKAREDRNSITRNEIWSQTLEPLFSEINLNYPAQE